jgi:hypothetical protein
VEVRVLGHDHVAVGFGVIPDHAVILHREPKFANVGALREDVGEGADEAR